MKALLLVLLLASSLPATAANILVNWSAPTAFTDSSPIPATAVITYNVYGGLQGQSKRLLTPIPISTTSITRTNVSLGVQCYTVTAIVNHQESIQSAEACTTVTAPPNPPGTPAAVTLY